MRAALLPDDVAGPAVICVQAGEVNTGAFDPFPECCRSFRVSVAASSLVSAGDGRRPRAA
jgi:hypothetical protein